MATNLFAKAKEQAIKQVDKGSKKKAVPEYNIEQLNDLAAIDAVMKSLDTMRTTIEQDIKGQMMSIFVDEGTKRKTRPKNFRGTDTRSSASCELKKRTSRSRLTQEEVDLLTKFGVSYDTSTDVTTTFIINPNYADDMSLLETVSKLLEGHVPSDFIQMQQGVEIRSVSDRSLDQVFESTDVSRRDMANLLKTVGTLSLKPIYEGDVTNAIEYVKDLLS